MLDRLRFPAAWDAARGVGGENILLHLSPYDLGWGMLARVGASFELAERLLFFVPLAIVPFLAMFHLMGRFVASGWARGAAALLYGANTYVLVTVNSGGHLFVGMAYGLAPIVIARCVDTLEPGLPARRAVNRALGGACWLGVTAMFDPRIALLSAVACVGYGMFSLLDPPRSRGVRLIVLLGVGVGLSSYWILPFLVATSDELLSFLPEQPWISWSTLGHSLALNHPFWTGAEPTYFETQPVDSRLIVIPVFALVGVAWASRRDHRSWFFLFLGLGGVILTTGENPPLGRSFTWAFTHVPGMNLFRDMSKFSLFTAIGFSVLVGNLVGRLVSFGATRLKRFGRARLLGITAAILITLASSWVPVSAAVAQRLGGTLEPRTLPQAAHELERTLSNDHDFGRVLWVPYQGRFGTRSRRHPALNATNLTSQLLGSGIGETRGEYPAGDPAAEVAAVLDESVGRLLQALSVRYVVVVREPIDWWSEMTPATQRNTLERIRASLDGQGELTLFARSNLYDVYSVSKPGSYVSVGPVRTVRGTRRPWALLDDPGGKPLVYLDHSTSARMDTPELRAHAVAITLDLLAGQYGRGVARFPVDFAKAGVYRVQLPAQLRADPRLSLDILMPGGDVLPMAGGEGQRTVAISAPGEYVMRLRHPRINANILPNPSFEGGPWTVFDGLRFDARSSEQLQIRADVVLDARNGEQAMKLSSHGHVAGACQRVQGHRAGDWYTIRFSWKPIAGPPPAYGLWWGDSVRTQRPSLGRAGGEWQTHAAVIESPTYARQFGICFYAGPGKTNARYGASLFDDVAIGRLPSGLSELFLVEEAKVASYDIGIAAVRRADGSGEVEVIGLPDGESVLRLSEGFRSDWEGRFVGVAANGTEIAVEATHMRALGDLNAWVIDVPPGLRSLRASFSFGGQRSVVLGVIVSLFTLVVTVLTRLQLRRRPGAAPH